MMHTQEGNEITGTFPSIVAENTMLSAPRASIYLNGTLLTGEVPDVLCPVEGLVYDCPPMCGCDCPCPNQDLLMNETNVTAVAGDAE
jgi:hypothetical protein